MATYTKSSVQGDYAYLCIYNNITLLFVNIKLLAYRLPIWLGRHHKANELANNTDNKIVKLIAN